MQNPLKHHAFHLAELRKALTTDPLEVMRASKRLKNSRPQPLFVYDFAAYRDTSKSKQVLDHSKASSRPRGAIIELNELEDLGAGPVDTAGSSNPSRKWSLFGEGKAAKFKA